MSLDVPQAALKTESSSNGWKPRFAQGRQAFVKGDFNEAIDIFSEVLRRSHRPPRLYDYSLVLPYSQVVQLLTPVSGPALTKVLDSRASAYVKVSSLKLAKADAKECIKLAPLDYKAS